MLIISRLEPRGGGGGIFTSENMPVPSLPGKDARQTPAMTSTAPPICNRILRFQACIQSWQVWSELSFSIREKE